MIENRLLRQQLSGRVRLSNGERKTFAEIGKQLGKRKKTTTWQERPHPGKNNVVLLSMAVRSQPRKGAMQYRERLGGLLKYYYLL